MCPYKYNYCARPSRCVFLTDITRKGTDQNLPLNAVHHIPALSFVRTYNG